MIKYRLVIILITVLKCIICQEISKNEKQIDWSYLSDSPYEWKKNFYSCNGHSQSPINIELNKIIYNPLLKPFKFINYNKKLMWNFTNNQHTVIMSPIYNNMLNINISVNGSNLIELFHLLQVHFHWSISNFKGSEHYIDNKSYPLEMHLVHQSNSKRFLVLGFLFELSNKTNSNLEQLIDGVSNAKDFNHFKIENFKLNQILPSENFCRSYIQYVGSLTTPPCTEGIIWNIFTKKIKVSKEQVKLKFFYIIIIFLK